MRARDEKKTAAPGGMGEESVAGNAKRPGVLTADVDAGWKGAGDVTLSPIKGKRKRQEDDSWRGAAHDGKPPDTARKKTRFVTAKGIREAGRDSCGTAGGRDEDDGLDIV